MVQTSIPEHSRLACDIKAVQKKPAFNGRRIGEGTTRWLHLLKSDRKYLDAYQIWTLRSGQNGGKGRDNPLWRYGGHNISHRPESHSLSLYVNPDLFETHPEYFAMNEAGKRYKPMGFAYNGSICMTNMKVK